MFTFLIHCLNRNNALKGKVKIAAYTAKCLLAGNLKSPSKGVCTICGNTTIFFDFGNDSEFLICLRCGSSGRNRALAKVLLDKIGAGVTTLATFNSDNKLKGYLAAANGSVADFLKDANFTLSEYNPDAHLGAEINGIYNQDLTKLTFEDEYFDVVVSESVLEHISDPSKSVAEVYRVLKDNGYYFLTVPFDSPNGQSYTRITADGTLLMELHTHKDPLRRAGIPVYTDFSSVDIISRYFIPFGFKAEIVVVEDTSALIKSIPVICAKKIIP